MSGTGPPMDQERGPEATFKNSSFPPILHSKTSNSLTRGLWVCFNTFAEIYLKYRRIPWSQPFHPGRGNR